MKPLKECFTNIPILLLLLVLSVTGKAESPFITRWNLTAPAFVYPGIGQQYTIEWELVNDPQVKGVIEDAGSQQEIPIPANGEYRIKAYNGNGVLSGFLIASNNYTRLLAIEQWGTIQWTKLDRAFTTSINMDVTATDVPDLSQVTSLSGIFMNCPKLVGNASFARWNTASVRDMSWMFSGAVLFDQDISSWNTENVTTMRGMFQDAKSFNQPIGAWKTQNVNSMENMFYNAEQFNKPIGDWNTGRVVYMSAMFCNAFSFNQPIGSWNVESVRTIDNIFLNAKKFNQNINAWHTISLQTMASAFKGDSAFNQPIGNWVLQNLYDKRILSVFNGTSMDCENYAATLAGWADNPLTPDGITLDASGLSYNAAAIPIREKLVSEKGWTINNDQYTEVCGVLPVTFGPVTAVQTNNSIIVSWKTFSEAGCDRFIIQASVDGKKFTDMGTVKSKSRDGNSSETLSYDYELPLLPMTAAFNIALLTGCFFVRKRRLLLVFCSLIALIWLSCARNKTEIAANSKQHKFIRIAQIDKDRSYRYSKVVKVTEK
ncbi:hypothetical protein A8C56_21480 [Niabella ginsenosidivorans]|uniref:BspA family leucine-rich repeat surface protein n=1 Tax=Niabella ginsenosidivorans TaxID=1176587 RepID=A0A1A9I6G5_9BACT|nr:BspA family leucine-rich repeat surface protein [Niabella ginsenosidivorans]ANH83206.1 hypothetical protein A8C56_21480 [Niabella ginsenosidivorans]